MRKVTIPLALAGVLVLSGCQNMDADTGGRTIGVRRSARPAAR
ncbi:MAG TPA: hypothetical protein VE592_07265 [Geminicoccaceae bacterium]|nr:hypothetical protein [Geminicoccaceae bacterium]